MEFKYVRNIDVNFSGMVTIGSLYGFNGVLYRAKVNCATHVVDPIFGPMPVTEFPNVIDPSQWEEVPMDCDKCSWSCTTGDQNGNAYGPHCYFLDKHQDACNENYPHFCAAFRMVNSGFMPMSL